MPKFRKKPIVIEAEVWFPGAKVAGVVTAEDVPAEALREEGRAAFIDGFTCHFPFVRTAEGPLHVSPGDFIITGVKGERYPCKPDIFAATYDQAPEAPAASPAGFSSAVLGERQAPPKEHILQFFAYAHLPPHLQAVSKPFCELAHAMVHGDNAPEAGTVTMGPPLPRNPERTVALRKLLESKDAAVRALIAKEQ